MCDSITGTCNSMCPKKELIMREKEGLLHKLEIDIETKSFRRPKADPSKIIKCYQRSSAGKSMNDPDQLRPGPVLLLTLRYLFTKVLKRTDVDWSEIYEFTFDRIRAIRQDMTIQRLNLTMSIMLLEPIVRFHIYAGERMCEKSSTDFVAKFNEQHLLECIKQLLVMYDERDASIDLQNDYAEMMEKFSQLLKTDYRAQIEALYLLLHLGNEHAIHRGLSLPEKYKNTPEVQTALRISLAWHVNNYVRVCREISKLTPLFAMAAMNNLKFIRKSALEIMNSSYICKYNGYSIVDIKKILLYNDTKKITADCTTYGIKFVDDSIFFRITQLKARDTLAHPEKHFADSVLDELLPDILLNY